jgi:RHS repeat-associated protein
MGNRTSATIASQGGGTFNYGSATTANQYTSITGRSAITHDANGNQLLNGAGAAFTWDSENRLLTVTPVSPNLGDKAHVHSYDGLHRRVTRTTREWTSSGWTNLETTYFIYDGWNVIEEWTSTFSPATTATLTRRLTWGQDLAGSPSLQGAGGVGGLLMVEEITSTTNEAYHFHYDGNGNVTEITDHLGASVATYRYDAFGNTLVATGTYATTNRYRFSTKPLDHEVTTAPLYYYGYRYYDPVTGRWSSRDPIEERGGVNLYWFVGNDGVNRRDLLGLENVGQPDGAESGNLLDIDPSELPLLDPESMRRPGDPGGRVAPRLNIIGTAIASSTVVVPMKPTFDAPEGTKCPDAVGNGMAWGIAEVLVDPGTFAYVFHTTQATGGQLGGSVGEVEKTPREGDSVYDLAEELATIESLIKRLARKCCEPDLTRQIQQETTVRITWFANGQLEERVFVGVP